MELANNSQGQNPPPPPPPPPPTRLVRDGEKPSTKR